MTSGSSIEALRDRSVASGEPVPRPSRVYHVFVASPGDVNDERNAVRAFFRSYNLNYAEPRGLHFEVVDWENYSTAGVGRPQELITEQTLNRYRDSLALVVGIMAQRFGSKSGTHESGTEEEFEWAVRKQKESGHPEVKWFFRDGKFESNEEDLDAAVEQWKKVRSFRKRVDEGKAVYTRSYTDLNGFRALLESDLGRWLNDPARPWFEPGSTPPRSSSEWPQSVVEALAARLSDDFASQMKAGEAVSAEQACLRYVTEVLKLRAAPSFGSSAPCDAGTRGPGAPNDEGPLEDFVARDGAQLLVIGGGGTGKTTMLKHLAAQGARRAAENSAAPVFVYLRLTAFDRSDGGLDLLLDRLGLAAHLDRQRFESLWRAGRRSVVFLLDGLNEVAQAHRASCAAALTALLQTSSPAHRYVITARAGGPLERTADGGGDPRGLRIADVQHFGPDQIHAYLAAHGRADLEERLSGRLKDLATNPFLLWAFTRVLASPGEREVGGSRGALFEAVIDRYIFGEREQTKPSPRPTTYNYELVKKPVLAALARKMLDDGVTVLAEGAEGDVLPLVAERLKALDRQREIKSEVSLEPEEFMPPGYAASSFVREVIENGLLVRERDGVRFMHESVQEYFAAVGLGTASVTELEAIAPSLSLAELDARGSRFETLVTWAGLALQENVLALVRRLEERHPLLAAALAKEAELGHDDVRSLSERFLINSRSEHEQRRRLGALGLAMVPSGDARVVDRLIELIEHPGEPDLSSAASAGLREVVSKGTLDALVAACVARQTSRSHAVAEFLRDLVLQHGAAIAHALADAWSASPSRRARVAELAAFLDTRSPGEGDRRSSIRERLLELAVDAELAGDRDGSGVLDALRHSAEQVPPIPTGIDAIFEQMSQNLDSIQNARAQRRECDSRYSKNNEAELEAIVRNGDPVQRAAALNVLVERGSLAAVAPVVTAVLSNPNTAIVSAVESLPREPVRAELAARIAMVEGPALARASLLVDLLADEPAREVLERAFQTARAEFRAFAAKLAVRSGPSGIDLVLAQIEREVDPRVLTTAIAALGQSRQDAALGALTDLVLEGWRRQHWPDGDRDEDGISDPERGRTSAADSWALRIHEILAAAGAHDLVLTRLEDRLRALRATPGSKPKPWLGPWGIVQEARRWLPDMRAAELLRSAATLDDVELRRWAHHALASAGDPDSWRALLTLELDTPPDFIGFAQDAARRLGALPANAIPQQQLISVSESVLRPALAHADDRRRAAALEITRRLPEGWVGGVWRSDSVATAEYLLRSTNDDLRIVALRTLRSLEAVAGDRILAVLLGDPGAEVRACAYRLLGDGAKGVLERELASAVRRAEADLARSIAHALRDNASTAIESARDNTAAALDSSDRPQFVAAVLALTTMRSGGAVRVRFDDEDRGWAEPARRARAALVRLGPDETWDVFAAAARSLPAEERSFVHDVLGVTAPEWPLAQVAARASALWSDDVIAAGLQILSESRRDKTRAIELISEVEMRFDGEINHRWLADRLQELGAPRDALRLYRVAAERQPDDADTHFNLGWCSFLTGDFGASVAATRRSLELRATNAMAYFNLGIALLASGDTVPADVAYRRGVAFAKRQPGALETINGALGDFALIPGGRAAAKHDVERIRAWLASERDHLEDATRQ